MSSSKKGHLDLKQLLLRDKIVEPDVLNEALKEHDKSQKPLLDIIFAMGKFDSRKLVKSLAKEYGYTSVNPAILVLDPEVISLIPKKFAVEHNVLPINLHEKTLTVAFANPTDLKSMDVVRAVTKSRVRAVVCDYHLIQKYIEKYYAEDAPGNDLIHEEDEQEEQLDELVKMIEVEQEEDAVADSSELMKEALETPIVKLVNMLLMEGIKRKASDIFIEPWERYIRVRARVDGMLEEMLRPPKSSGAAIVSRIKIMSTLNIAEHRIPQDGRFKVKVGAREIDMRVSILPTTFGEKVCLRVLDTSSQSHDIEKLGFSEEEQLVIKDCAQKPHGMILVTGPTGSGKTTTLYSVLEYLDAPEVNITTVEDPVEYQIPGINQVNVKDQVGLTFPAALRSILRQDPDIILIGEIRDNDTLDIAVKAALTGHLVLSTLHTNDAASSITRMANMGLEPFLISSTVLMISAQRLIRRLCERCKVKVEVEPAMLERLGIDPKAGHVFYEGKGCAQCRQSGYSGRTVITEILQMGPAIRQLVMQGKSAEDIKNYAREHEMTTLRGCAIKKAIAGETSINEVYRITSEEFGKKECEEEEAA